MRTSRSRVIHELRIRDIGKDEAGFNFRERLINKLRVDIFGFLTQGKSYTDLMTNLVHISTSFL